MPFVTVGEEKTFEVAVRQYREILSGIETMRMHTEVLRIASTLAISPAGPVAQDALAKQLETYLKAANDLRTEIEQEIIPRTVGQVPQQAREPLRGILTRVMGSAEQLARLDARADLLGALRMEPVEGVMLRYGSDLNLAAVTMERALGIDPFLQEGAFRDMGAKVQETGQRIVETQELLEPGTREEMLAWGRELAQSRRYLEATTVGDLLAPRRVPGVRPAGGAWEALMEATRVARGGKPWFPPGRRVRFIR